MDTAVSVLQSIYDVYKSIKDGQDQFHATYTRMHDLLAQFRAMESSETLVQTKLLDKYIAIARDFLAYLDKYKRRKFLSKVIHQSEMLAEIDGFNVELEALFQLFHLAMGSHIVEHNRSQSESIDELLRGMRVLLQGSGSRDGLKSAQSSDELLEDPANTPDPLGPVAAARDNRDVATLVGFINDSATNEDRAKKAAKALCELAEEEAIRDAIVDAGGIDALAKLLHSDASSRTSTLRVHVTRVLRRLAVRDVYEDAIVDAGAVALLAAMLCDASSTEAETSAACAALANLAFQVEHKLVILRTVGLLPRLVELVRLGCPAQKRHAANTLRELARNEECAAAIDATGGIIALVDLLHIGTPEQCVSALQALWNLVSRQDHRTKIAAVGGINAIVAQIRRDAGPESDNQRQLAASTLAVLAQDDANDTLIGAAGGVELLVALLQTGTEGQKNSAAWALAELANQENNATVMARSGVVVVVGEVYCVTSMKRTLNIHLALHLATAVEGQLLVVAVKPLMRPYLPLLEVAGQVCLKHLEFRPWGWKGDLSAGSRVHCNVRGGVSHLVVGSEVMTPSRDAESVSCLPRLRVEGPQSCVLRCAVFTELA